MSVPSVAVPALRPSTSISAPAGTVWISIDVIVGLAGSLTSPLSLLNGWVIGGAVSRVAPAATAVGPRDPGFELRLIANWRPGDADDRHRAWVRDGWAALRPFSSGQYASFLSDEGPAGVRTADGVLAGVTAKVDDVVPVGQTIAWLLKPGESVPAPSGAPQQTGRKMDSAPVAAAARVRVAQ